MQQPPRLNPKDLFEQRVKRDSSRLRSYNQLLQQIHQRIYTTSQMNGNSNFILYTVPPFIFGLPKIDLQDCIVYLVHMLRQASYEVRYTYPNLLYVSWKQHERDYLLTQNPIMQAMAPPQIKKERKAEKKVSFQPAAGPIKSATDYRPPPSFVQTIEKPLPERKNDILSDLWNFS